MAFCAVQVVQAVLDKPGITGAELGVILGVTDRSVRAYVKRANDSLADCAEIVSGRGRGYSLAVRDERALRDWFEWGNRPVGRGGASPDERVALLLNVLLARTDWVTVDELSELLHVCRMTISVDLKRVEERLVRFELRLERRPRYGIRVSGDEMHRRVCLAAGVVESLSSPQLAGFRPDEEESLPRVSLELIARIVDESLDQSGWSINSLAYQNLLVHIAITVLRSSGGNYLPMDGESLARIQGSAAFDAARLIAERVEGLYGISLPQSEVAYIAIHLAGKQSTISGADGEDGGGSDPLVINDEVWDAVSEMLNLVWDVYHFDLRTDLELRMNLARHVAPLSVRLRYGMKLENPVLSDTKRRYPLAYAMAVDSGVALARRYGSMLSEDETGYLALAFALALERQKTSIAKKSILVVCATGHGSACMLEHRYRQQFGGYLDAIYTCDASHVDHFDFSKVDYAFTTVPLGRPLPVPVREVGFFLDDADAELVSGLLKSPVPDAGVRDVFSSRIPVELFLPHAQAVDKDSLLDDMCERMVRCARVDASLRELVDRREAYVPTAFGNRVAIPHPLEPVCDEAVCEVALLDEPIDWSGRDVSVVVLIAISRVDGAATSRLMGAVADFVTDAGDIERLLETRSREALIARLNALLASTA